MKILFVVFVGLYIGSTFMWHRLSPWHGGRGYPRVIVTTSCADFGPANCQTWYQFENLVFNLLFWAVIYLMIVAIIKKTHYKHFKRVLISISALVIILIVWSGYDRYKVDLDRIFRESDLVIPKATSQLTDKYILDKVGPENFVKYYKYDKLSSYRENSGYIVTYRFQPFDQYYNYPQYKDISLKVEGKVNISSFGKNSVIPDCLEDESLCSFNITKDDLITILKDQDWGINNNHQAPEPNFQPPYLIYPQCGSNWEQDQDDKAILIDYRTKQITIKPAKEADTKICQPIQVNIPGK